MRVCIDPGHGGHEPGAVSLTGTREKDINLAAAGALLRACEERGFQVYTTRGRDVFISLRDRVRSAIDVKADVVISLHANGSTNPQAHGSELWTSPGETESDKIATAIYGQWIKDFGSDAHVRTDYSDGDPDKEAEFYVLVHTPMPAVLVELGFVTNPLDEAMIVTEGFLDIAAGAIADGISDWRGRRPDAGRS